MPKKRSLSRSNVQCAREWDECKLSLLLSEQERISPLSRPQEKTGN
jgi:hypothetical protein